jgi:hypothetical protein
MHHLLMGYLQVEIAFAIAIVALSSVGYYVFYQLYLSPLAKIPGPMLAALTRWYEWYLDCVLPGQYSFKMQEMHKTYGKVITHDNIC